MHNLCKYYSVQDCTSLYVVGLDYASKPSYIVDVILLSLVILVCKCLGRSVVVAAMYLMSHWCPHITTVYAVCIQKCLHKHVTVYGPSTVVCGCVSMYIVSCLCT